MWPAASIVQLPAPLLQLGLSPSRALPLCVSPSLSLCLSLSFALNRRVWVMDGQWTGPLSPSGIPHGAGLCKLGRLAHAFASQQARPGMRWCCHHVGSLRIILGTCAAAVTPNACSALPSPLPIIVANVSVPCMPYHKNVSLAWRAEIPARVLTRRSLSRGPP